MTKLWRPASNAWNVSEDEYNEAKRRELDTNLALDERADYWQLVRFYRGDIFIRDAAARAVRQLRDKA